MASKNISPRKEDDWSVHHSFMVMTVVLVVLATAFTFVPQLGELTDYYLEGTLTGMSVAQIYEAQIVVKDMESASAVIQAVSRYDVRTDTHPNESKVIIHIFSNDKNGVYQAANAGSVEAQKSGGFLAAILVR